MIRWIRSILHEKIPPELPAELSFRKIYDLSLKHDLCNLVFYAVERLQRKPEEPLFSQWRTRKDLALSRDMNQEFAREELVQAFQQKEIPFLELQGTALKKLYPHTEYRTMSDLDFIIPLSRLNEGGEILRTLGYDITLQNAVEIEAKRIPNIYTEIHTEYFSRYIFLYKSMGEPNFSGDRSREERLRELYLYNMLHVAKHYFYAGCGIRRVLDIYYLSTHYAQELESLNMEEEFQRAGILDFSHEITALAQDWFGEGELRLNESLMAQRILGGSLHGDCDSFVRSRIAEVSGQSMFGFGAKCKYLLQRLFPMGRGMHLHYPVLKKWTICYPFCWVHRGFKLLFTGGLSGAVGELRSVVKAKEDRRERH